MPQWIIFHIDYFAQMKKNIFLYITRGEFTELKRITSSKLYQLTLSSSTKKLVFFPQHVGPKWFLISTSILSITCAYF